MSDPVREHRYQPPQRGARVFESPPARLVSLDAYRGFVMLAMVSGGLGLHALASKMLERSPDHPLWPHIGFHAEHVLWEGCSFWDLIQPSFMFMVGVAMAFSLAKRRHHGQSWFGMLGHALLRASLLVLLGVFLRSNGREQTNFTFVDVVSQIGLGYVFLFPLWRQNWVTQLVAALAILVCYWCFFFFYQPPEGLVLPENAFPKDYVMLTGIRAPWNMHLNPAAEFDRWFLNLFPQTYTHTSGGYQTLNFIPSLATMIFGLIAGKWLRSDRSLNRRCLGLLVAGAIGIGLGYVLHVTGACPVVKKIWTPSWAIYSAGWASVLLGLFFFLFDVINLRPIAWPLTVVGLNSLVIYVLSHLIGSTHNGWLVQTIRTHLGAPFFRWIAPALQEPIRSHWTTTPPANVFELFGDYRTVAQSVFVLLMLWGLALWLYRRKIFLRT